MSARLVPDAFDALRMAEGAAATLDVSEVPRFAGELERVKVALLLRVVATVSEPAVVVRVSEDRKDRSLSAEEVGRMYGRSKWWVYDHAHELPRVQLPGGRFGFSERAVERDIERRKTAGLDPGQEFIRQKIRAGGRSRARVPATEART